MQLVPPEEISRPKVFLLCLKLTILAVPFFFAGACLASVFRSYASQAGVLYGCDLIGSAAAAFIAVPLLNTISTPSVVLVSALTTSFSALVLSRFGSPSPQNDNRLASIWMVRAAPSLALVVTAVLLVTNILFGWFEVTHTKGVEDRPIIQKWNALARLTVYPRRGHMRLVLDGNAATYTPQFDGDIRSARGGFDNRPAIVAYQLRPEGRALIIGPGGGMDVLAALTVPALKIDAVEINPAIIQVVQEDFGSYSGHLYSDPRVSLSIDEGRSFVSRSSVKYDVINISMIDTFAASASGALALSENNLYTVEAFHLYLSRLGEDGILSVTWWGHTDKMVVRLINLAHEAIRNRGESDPFQHIVVISDDDGARERMTLLAKSTPFVSAELDTLEYFISRYRWKVLSLAKRVDLVEPFISDIQQSTRSGGYSERLNAVISPPTDDKPFIFYAHRWRDYFTGVSSLDKDQVLGWTPVFLLSTLLVSTAGIALLTAGWPILFRNGMTARRIRPTARIVRWAGYFCGLGIGFMAVETAMMQVFVLFLGHPTYALSCILFSMLLFAGLGSIFFGKPGVRRQRATLTLAILGIPLSVVLILAIKPWLFKTLIGSPLPSKLLVSLCLLAPLSFLMGAPFQAGLRALGEEGAADAIPWVWAVNSTTSVFGSVTAIVLALHEGFSVAALFGAIAYILAAGLLPRRTMAPS